MIADARAAGLPARLHADVVIVGSGPAGITLALELAEAGTDVVLVEAGGARFDRAQQAIYRAQDVQPPSHGPVDMFRRRVLGGSSSVWGGRCIPFDPIDFAERPWMPHARWPIGYEDVAPYYPAALRWAEAGAPDFTADAALPGEQRPMVAGVASADVVLDRVERFSRPSDFAKTYAARLRAAARLRLFTHAPVTQILAEDGGARVRGVRLSVAGCAVEVIAPRVVLAAGGLETARLLLASDEAMACGLGNGHDLVGRFYQCHLEGEIGAIALNRATARIGYSRAVDGTYCRRLIWLSPAAQRREHLAGLVLRPAHPNIVDPAHRNPVLSAMYLVKSFIVAEYARKMTSLEAEARAAFNGGNVAFHAAHLANILRGSPRLALFGADWLRRRNLASRKLPSVVLEDRRGVYPLDINAEQEPDPASRVHLGAERDSLGMRRLVIDWRTTAADHDRLARGMALVAQGFAQGPGRARIDLGDDFAARVQHRVPVGGHHIGTARMAVDARQGVCDRNGEVFGTQGLFVAGAATFATSGFANPTLVLLALTLRLADHLKAVPVARETAASPADRSPLAAMA